MSSRYKAYLIVTFVICSVFLFSLMAPDAYGRRFRLSKVPENGRAFRCLLCHVNPKGRLPLNPFGKDWEKIAIPAGEKYTEELGKLDSDGDGFTNDQEFEAKTNPGDPLSKPESK
jgi:hypothetical protein